MLERTKLLNVDNESLKKAQAEVNEKRNVESRQNFRNLLHGKSSDEVTEPNSSQDSSEGSLKEDFDLEMFKVKYSPGLKKLSDFYDTADNKSFFNEFNKSLCNNLKKIGDPIFINTFLKREHFSFAKATEITKEIEIFLSELDDYPRSDTTDYEYTKLVSIRYALCKCTKDRHGKDCILKDIRVRVEGGKRRKHKKTRNTKRRRSNKKRRRHTRKH